MKVVKCVHGTIMNVDRNSYLGGSIYWLGFHHLQEILYLDKRLKDNMVFLDIGANQGEFSMFAANKLTKGRVLAFEPVTKTRNLLKENMRLNSFSNLEIFPFGLSDQKGSFPIYTSTASDLYHGQNEGLSSLYQSDTRSEVEEIITLEIFDAFFKPNELSIDFIKIDVEGAELFALKGMNSFLEKYKPEILIEINEETFIAAGYETKDITAFLESLGYRAFKIVRGVLTPIENIAMSSWGNYIFRAEG